MKYPEECSGHEWTQEQAEHWLRENAILGASVLECLVCEVCYCPQLQATSWYEMNTGEDTGGDPPRDDVYCPNCETDTCSIEAHEAWGWPPGKLEQVLGKTDGQRRWIIPTPEIQKVLVLSTHHVPTPDGPADEIGDDTCAFADALPYGWRLYVEGDELPDPREYGHLEEVVIYARALGCQWVHFDKDADVMPHLPNWEW
jgi:hypothetical protein